MREPAAGGLRERSQFAGHGSGAGEVEVVVQRACGGGFGLGAGAAELVIGAMPGAFEGGDLALHAEEEFGGGRLGKEDGGEGAIGRFGSSPK